MCTPGADLELVQPMPHGDAAAVEELLAQGLVAQLELERLERRAALGRVGLVHEEVRPLLPDRRVELAQAICRTV